MLHVQFPSGEVPVVNAWATSTLVLTLLILQEGVAGASVPKCNGQSVLLVDWNERVQADSH